MAKKTKTNKELTEKQLAILKENALGILSNTRKMLLDRYPFYGTVAMGLEIVPVRDCRLTTMCTDGNAIYSDIDFLNSLTNDDKLFVIGHEILHNIMLHFVRCEGRDTTLFNIATDIEVNNILKKDGFSVPKFALTPKSYNFPDDLSAEQYYDLLIKETKKSSKTKGNSSRGENNNDSSGSSIGNSGSIDSDISGSAAGGKDGTEEEGDGNCDSNGSSSSNKSGSSEPKLSEQFDKHIYKGEELSEADEVGYARTDSYGKVGIDKDFRPSVSESNAERVRESAISAAQTVERQYGNLPSHLKKLVADLLEPKLDWKELLCKYVIKTQGIRRTWNIPNRRFVSRRIYLPSSYGDKIKVGVVLDTSGSVSSYIKRFLSELVGIVNQFDGYEITIVQCDTKVQNVKTITNEDPYDFEHEKFEMHGFGGTELTPGLQYFENNEIDIDCIVCLTDGYFGSIPKNDQPQLPVLWCVTKDGTTESITFGDKCRIDD